MADPHIDEAEIIAWVDGELDDAAAARVAQAVTADPVLGELAESHRQMKARFAKAFGPIAEMSVPVSRPAPVISLAAARAEREARAAPPPARRWAIPGAIAASLVVGMLMGHRIGGPAGLADRPDALALSAPIAQALDGQLAGQAGPVRVALSFRDRAGAYCRSFTATNVAGVACHQGEGWRLRYASPGAPAGQGDYRMAGTDAAQAGAIAAMIAGNPLDADAERKARLAGWR
jgi:hypothetical protein